MVVFLRGGLNILREMGQSDCNPVHDIKCYHSMYGVERGVREEEYVAMSMMGVYVFSQGSLQPFSLWRR